MPPVFSKKKAAEILATVLLLGDREEERIKKKRKWWKNWVLKRNLYSHMKYYYNYVKMDPTI
jgi:hypothetical protein